MEYDFLEYMSNKGGIYDKDPADVRAEMFYITFNKRATHAVEFCKLLVTNIDSVLKDIADGGYEPYQVRDSIFPENHQKRILYFVNRPRSSMVSVMINAKDLNRSRLDEPFWDESDEQEYDGRRFNFLAIQTTHSKEVDWLSKIVKKYQRIEETKNKLFLLKSTEYGGTELSSFPMENLKCDLELNYGTNFRTIHEKIVSSLKDKKSGLYILHSPPGTGKTSYIRYLTTQVSNRRFIFVPNIMVASIFSPKMVQSLYTFKDSVLILEDAELCIFKRDGSNNELVSGVLNITDGLLRDLLNISIFVTFNAMEISELDKALLRKGRLRAMYKFDPLSKSDSQKLLVELKKPNTATGPMTLAEIYNVDEEVDLGGELIPVVKGFGSS